MRRDKPNQIHVSLSLREEVPLRRSKDAWKPTIFSNDPKVANDEDKKTEVRVGGANANELENCVLTSNSLFRRCIRLHVVYLTN